MNDHEISEDVLERVRSGDIAGLEALYHVFADRVYRLCRSVLGNDHAAEDAAQEVFLRIFEKLKTFDGRCRLSTWIYRLTVNHCLNWRRRFARWPMALLESAFAIQDDASDGRREADRIAARDEVDSLMRGLSVPQRTILALREIMDLDYREISKVLDIPEGTVMSRLSRARTALERGVAVRTRAERGESADPARPREASP